MISGFTLSPTSQSCLISLQMRPATQARMQYSTAEGREPRLVVSVVRSQPMMSSIRCEARMSKTDEKRIL